MAGLSGLLQVTRSMRSPTLDPLPAAGGTPVVQARHVQVHGVLRKGISDSQFTNAIIYEFSPLL